MGSTLGVLAFVLVIVLLLSHGRNFSRRFGRGRSTHTVHTVDIQGAKKANGKLEMSAGQLNIYSAASHLVDADFTFSGSFADPRVNYSVKDGVGELDISQDSGSVHFGNSQNEWNVQFSREVPLALRIEMGAGQGNLHFRDIPLTRLDLNIGAGQVDV